MTHKTADFVEQIHTGFTGTGEYTDAGGTVPNDCRSIASQLATGDTAYFTARGEDASGNGAQGIEVFLGTKTATGLTRTTLVASTTGAFINWSTAASVRVSLTAPASKIAQFDNLNGMLMPLASSIPAVPPSGYMTLFAKPQGGRLMLAMMGPSGLDTVLQPHLAKNGWGVWKPTFTGTTITAIGGAALTATGTATSAPYAVTSLHTRAQRVDYLVTTAATTAVAGFRVSTATWRGQEGFHFIFRACPATGVAGVSTRRCFIGMQASTGAPTDVNPSTLLNIVGVGYDSTDTNWQVMTNNGTGAAAKVDTGIAKPSSDRQTIYSVMIFCPPGGAWFAVRIVDEATGSSYESAQLSADIPATTQLLTPNCYASVGGTSSVVGLTMAGLWFDTDN